MHISEGILPWQTLAAGAALTAAGVAIGLKRLKVERVPLVAALASTFFVASLIHLPTPGSSVHLILNGLTGLLLGWAAFPALLVALGLQAVFFQFGGISTLGVNSFNMAFPAVLCYYLFHRTVTGRSDKRAAAAAFGAGALSVLLAWGFLALELRTAGKPFEVAILLNLFWHLPVMLIEGLVTMSAVTFLRKVRPELLGPLHERPPAQSAGLQHDTAATDGM
jgi:cobalt/nickel transport system permease protein